MLLFLHANKDSTIFVFLENSFANKDDLIIVILTEQITESANGLNLISLLIVLYFHRLLPFYRLYQNLLI